MTPDIAIHRARRSHLLEILGEGVLILATAPEALRNRDAHYPYRFDSHFHYLTAFPEPEAVLVLIAGAAGTCGSVLGWLVNHFMSTGASGTGQ